MPSVPVLADTRTWAIHQFRPTIPLQQVEAHLNDPAVRTVVLCGGNRSRKSTGQVWITAKAMVGCYAWAPQQVEGIEPGVYVGMVTKALHLAGTALQGQLERFLLYGLPRELIQRRTTQKEITTPIRLTTGSRMDIKTEAMGWEHLQGAGWNLGCIDEFPEPTSWKELRARARAGVPYKMLVGFTPTDGPDGWFTQHVVEPALRGERAAVRVVRCAVFSNGDPGCRTCGKGPVEYDAILATLGLRREFQFHAELKKLCARCHGYGIEQAMDAGTLQDWEDTYEGNDLGIRLYGEFLAVRGGRCFTPAEIQALLTGCQPGEAKGGVRYWPRDPHEPCVGGVDAAEGLGVGHSETVGFFTSAVHGVQVGLYADDEAQFHDYRDTLDWCATQPFGMPAGGGQRTGAYLCIERKSMGTTLIEEYKTRPHLTLYHQRNVHARTHDGGMVWGWVSHAQSRDELFRNLFAGIRRNLRYDAQGNCTGMKAAPDPRGLWIKDRETIEQLRHLFYDREHGNRVSTPSHRRDDRVIAAGLAHEARMHRAFRSRQDAREKTPYEAWQEAVIERHREYPPESRLPAAGWVEENGVLRPTGW